MTQQELATLKEITNTAKWDWKPRLLALIESAQLTEEPKGTRTGQQNRAIHLYLTQVANALNDAGWPMQKVLTVDIDWDGDNAKEYLWRPVQKAQLKKQSTRDLTKAEVTKIYETLNRLLGEKFGIHVPFPSDETRQLEELGGYKAAAGTYDVPEMDDSNRADKF